MVRLTLFSTILSGPIAMTFQSECSVVRRPPFSAEAELCTRMARASPPQGGREMCFIARRASTVAPNLKQHAFIASSGAFAVMVVSLTVNGTVLIDGAASRSCVMPIGALTQSEIITLEGLGTLEQPHPLQSAFMAEQAAQCGYCIAGMIMMGKAILDRNPRPSEADVRLGLIGNLCRCGTHNRIVRAILKAARAMGRS